MTFELEIEGSVAELAINRPEKKNALPRSAWAELESHLGAIAADDSIRTVVLHGIGGCFSVGGDIKDMLDLDGPSERRDFLMEAVSAVGALEELTKPVVTAVHGPCLGGGLELALVSDITVASEEATFGVPESRVGLVPGVLMARGPSRMDAGWLRYLALTGEIVGADSAREAGLVHEVVHSGEHLSRAREIASLIAERAPLSTALIKEVVRDGKERPYADAVQWGVALQSSEDFIEGVAAFNERRNPSFRGR